MLLNYLNIRLSFHDLNHHPGTQLEAVLEDQAVGYGLELMDAVCVFLKQLFLLIRCGGFEFFFIPTDQFL